MLARTLLSRGRQSFHCRSRLVTSSRYFSTSQTDENKKSTNITTVAPSSMSQSRLFVDATARGIGQVVFLNSPTSGAILLGGLVLGDPYLATMATLGTMSATATAKLVGLDVKDGLLGYNGCLIGCAMSVFGPASIMACATSSIVGAAASPFVALSLKDIMGQVPQWTFAFNAVALTTLLRTRPMLSPTEVSQAAVSKLDLAMAPLMGISQIFIVESFLAGGCILGGIVAYSPGLAAHAVMGSSIGLVVGALTGAESSELVMGLWGFNPALTSMAVGTFFVHSRPTVALSAGGAAATSAVFGAMKTIFGEIFGSPCLTLPFCFTMSAVYLLRNNLPFLENMLAKSPHSPEENTSA